MTQTLNLVFQEIGLAQNQTEKFQYLVEIGDLLVQDPKIKTSPNLLIPGCASHTFAQIRVSDQKLYLDCFSDSHITRGYLYIIKQGLDELAPKNFPQRKTFLLEKFQELDLVQTTMVTRTNIPSRVLDFLEQQLIDTDTHI